MNEIIDLNDFRENDGYGVNANFDILILVFLQTYIRNVGLKSHVELFFELCEIFNASKIMQDGKVVKFSATKKYNLIYLSMRKFQWMFRQPLKF